MDLVYEALEQVGMARDALAELPFTIGEWNAVLRDIGWYNPYSTRSIEQYLDKNITKQEMAKQFFSLQNVTERERYFQGIQNMYSLMQKYLDQINDIVYFLMSYPDLKNIFDSNSIQQLELVQKAMTVESMADLARRGDLLGITSEIQKAMRENTIS